MQRTPLKTQKGCFKKQVNDITLRYAYKSFYRLICSEYLLEMYLIS
jgi:hypothetical protein